MLEETPDIESREESRASLSPDKQKAASVIQRTWRKHIVSSQY
jgi:hypothetical protein